MARSVRATAREVLTTLGVAVAYVACAKLGLVLAVRAHQVTAVWPPTGFALAAVLRLGRGSVAGVFLGAFLSNATAEEPLWVAAGIALGNTIEAWIGAAILRHLKLDGRLARVRDVIALIATVAVIPLTSATIGVTCLGVGGVQPSSSLPGLWLVWYLGDAFGGLIVAPLLLVWSDRDSFPRRRGAAIEWSALMLTLTTSCAVAFIGLPRVATTEYLVFPFLMWAALRFGPPGTATATLMTNVLAVWGTHLGRGPFAGAGPEQGLVLLQIYMGVAATTGLLFGATSAQNRQEHERAELSEQRLLLAMSAARMTVWDWNITDDELGSYRKLIHPDDLPRVNAAIADAVLTRSPYKIEFRVRDSDGSERWTEARGRVVHTDAGRAGRMIGVTIDISAQKQLEEALRLQAKRKDEFLAMLGHELRNPIAPIVHAVELLGRRNPSVATNAREIIRRQSEHLNRLVEDLLDVSRITRDVIRLERERVLLKNAIAPAVEMWRPLITERRQRLTVDLPEKPVWLEVDRVRFTQIIANLLHNAAKFTPEEGRISLTARVQEGSLLLQVRDSGEGMEQAVLAHVFELFVQARPPADRPKGGLGIGLTLVQRLVQLHGGTIEAKSEGAGRGSEFSLRLPLVGAPLLAALQKGTAPAEPAASSRRVLVVEDNADAREAMTLLLREEGHDVRAAGDGLAALAELEHFTPEVVFLDIGLPGLDGYDMARKLRMLPQTSRAMLVAVTGYGLPEDRHLSRDAGFDHHLLKPVEPARLIELLR